MRHLRKKYTWILFVAMAVLLVACSNDEANENGFYPFTGLETTEGTTDRAYSVMVNNDPKARPQSGLSKADIVFEMLTEGDITRFLAIYQSMDPDVVGPVRSAREYFFTLADGYDSIYVYHGAAAFIDDMIQSRQIENLPGAKYDNDGQLFVREPFRKAPHNSYFQFGAADEVAAEQGYETEMTYEPLPFLADGEEVDGEDVRHVKINYSSNSVVEYEYDEANEAYTRYDDGEITIELDSEIPIEIDNVLIAMTEHRIIDDENRKFIDIESGGPAYLLQRGKVKSIEWKNRDGRIIPVEDGQVVPFVPGQTWINFVPDAPPKGVGEQVELNE